MTPEESLALQTKTGRRWLGYWYLRGIKPTPAGVTMDDIDAMLEGADIERMDRQVAAGRERILRSYGRSG